MTEIQHLRIELDKMKDEVKHRERVISDMVSRGFLQDGEVRAKWITMGGESTLVEV